jgi:hypothetical protein
MTSAKASAQEEEFAHLRLAIGGVGGFFLGDTNGGMGGLHIQAGVQINRLVAVFYQGQQMAGLFDNAGSIFSFNQAMVDFTIADTLQLGVGPSIDFISGCQNDNNLVTRCSDVSFFGADGRIAVVLGRHRHWRRSGLMLGFDVHPTFLDNNQAIVSLLFSISGALY